MMHIRPTLDSDFKNFTPAYHDILEAKAMGIDSTRWPDASECVTLDLNGIPLAIGGELNGQCWFVTSEKVDALSRPEKGQFRRLVMDYRDSLLEHYDVLWNFVFIGNTPHIRFLKSIGAVFHDTYTLGGKLQLFTIGDHSCSKFVSNAEKKNQ